MIFYSSFFGYAEKTENTIKNKTGFITTKKNNQIRMQNMIQQIKTISLSGYGKSLPIEQFLQTTIK
jgi:hypothetical protein